MTASSQDVVNLVKIWLDMMRPVSHHLLHERCEQFAPSLNYYKIIENIEKDIAEKMQISIPEVRIMLCCKKKMKDLEEKKLFES